ncbi:carboxypeptidase-like regulatory domain-containing protein [Geofilum sp. OHC36d9]|uniref:carboxypeptidase-like regulatory domain-containing protein n=1 Tax=Geofilum sp. OHC36d9 TaxID=3458413 RepID=UPI00403339B0
MKTKMILAAMLMITSMVFAGEKKPIEASPAAAATNTIAGTVLDNKTGEPLTGVEIQIEGTDVKTYTDFDGKFAMEGISSGQYTISANLISYQENETKTIRVNSNELHALNLMLKSIAE